MDNLSNKMMNNRTQFLLVKPKLLWNFPSQGIIWASAAPLVVGSMEAFRTERVGASFWRHRHDPSWYGLPSMNQETGLYHVQQSTSLLTHRSLPYALLLEQISLPNILDQVKPNIRSKGKYIATKKGGWCDSLFRANRVETCPFFARKKYEQPPPPP